MPGHTPKERKKKHAATLRHLGGLNTAIDHESMVCLPISPTEFAGMTFKPGPGVSIPFTSQKHSVVITDSDGNVIDSTLEHMGSGRYRIKFATSVIHEDLECNIKWHEDV